MNVRNDHKAGFWIRLLATWVDCIIVFCALELVFYLLVFLAPSRYFPFNFTFFVVGLTYSVVLIANNGQTPGKSLLGIKVFSADGKKLTFVKSLLRETLGKIISGVFLLLGFFWIGFSKNKMAWHDYVVQSKVMDINHPMRGNFWKIAVLASFVLYFGNYAWNFFTPLIDARKMSVNPASIKLPFMERDSSSLENIAALKDTSFVNWLDSTARTPEDYAVYAAATHQVTMFGEMHENKANLDFFNEVIPQLYHKSGVRVIAMEVITSSMNKKLERLVNAATYDSVLALEIARSQPWKLWGSKEYWDVLKTVWKLNRSLPDTAEKMRIIGIDEDWIMANFALLGRSQDSRGKSGFWEKFRVFSAIQDFPKVSGRDNLMAENIEKEVIAKHTKAAVWIGFNHTMVNFTPCIQDKKKLVATTPRFGVLLNQRFPNTVFQVEMFHHLILADSDTLTNYNLNDFLDSVMNQRSNKPCGFTIARSPFEKLRDSCLSVFTKYSTVCYGDIAQGLIFLKGYKNGGECTWQPGYISNEMFMQYKPLYDAIFGRNPAIKFANAKELNQVLVANLGKEN